MIFIEFLRIFDELRIFRETWWKYWEWKAQDFFKSRKSSIKLKISEKAQIFEKAKKKSEKSSKDN